MDNKTIQAYNRCAKQIAELHNTLVPTRIYQLINQFFNKNGICADIGCGTGRDSAWLSSHGYPVIGLDASYGMLQQAKQHNPNIHYVQDSLPLLKSQQDSYFINILCSAVIMHLEDDSMKKAVTNITRITVPGGVIILSFRSTDSKNHRENDKLYNKIEKEELISLFNNSGAVLIHNEIENENKRNFKWTNVVFRKLPHLVAQAAI